MIKHIYIRELEPYSKSKLDSLGINRNILNQIRDYVRVDRKKEEYTFKFVGIILIEDLVINFYPKYVPNEENIVRDFKLALNAIKKYNDLYEEASYANEELDNVSFNLFSLMLFFLEDYYENGVYTNIQNILEINGNGEIYWDKTINDTYPIIKGNKPYYMELHTRHKIDDIYDYFRLLHECIITECSKLLEEADLLDYFDLTSAELSDKTLDDFGDGDYILNRLEKELNREFNTHKQKLLKSMHAYISKKNSYDDENLLTLYGTGSYHVIWEEMCSKVFSNKLDDKLEDLIKNCEDHNIGNIENLINKCKKYGAKSIKDLIKKPIWRSNEGFSRAAEKTFIPDIVTCHNGDFIILDAKYYNLTFEEDELSGQPGIESISKQYFYELAYKSFINDMGFGVKNAFLFPAYDYKEIKNRGCVELEMLSSLDLDLQKIQIIMLPANVINKKYLNNDTISISKYLS